jgi:hypothetical protein
MRTYRNRTAIGVFQACDEKLNIISWHSSLGFTLFGLCRWRHGVLRNVIELCGDQLQGRRGMLAMYVRSFLDAPGMYLFILPTYQNDAKPNVSHKQESGTIIS